MFQVKLSPEDWIPVPSLLVQVQVVVAHHPKPAVLQHLSKIKITLHCEGSANYKRILKIKFDDFCKDSTMLPASSFCKR